MPILNCLVAPDASWQLVVDACNVYGVECVFFRSDMKTSLLQAPTSGKQYTGCLRVLYSEDLRGLKVRGILQKMEKAKNFNYLVILGAPPQRFSNIRTYEGPIRTLIAHHFELSLIDDSLEVDLAEYDHHKDVVTKYLRDSILSRVSQLLYRIKDKTERATVSQQVYRYLSGDLKRPVVTPIKQLNEVMLSEIAKRYNVASREVRQGEPLEKVAKKHSVDWFEISYCIRKTTTDPTLLDLVTFKDT